jgi:hypothetical protein
MKETQVNDKNTAHSNIFKVLVQYDVTQMTLLPIPLLHSLFHSLSVSPHQLARMQR